MEKLETLISYMQTNEVTRPIQEKQTAHRMQLAEAFNIQPGDRILEIGSGQGDTTVVLADAVGASGHVHAVDIASSDYGAPMTLKEATDVIAASEIGDRITFSFETNVLDPDFDGTYDAVILSHSLFYFSSIKDLVAIFKKARKLADKICIADWDLEVKNYRQTAHAQAILMQALYAQFHETDANIRTIITKELMRDLLIQTKWDVREPVTISAAELDDASWEVDLAKEIDSTTLEPALSAFKQLLTNTEKLGGYESLDSFILIGE